MEKIKLATKFDSDIHAISYAESEVNSAASAECRAAATKNLNEVLDQVEYVTLEKLSKQFETDGEIFAEFVPDNVEDVFAVLKLVAKGESELIDAWLVMFEKQFNVFHQNCMTEKCHYNRPVYPSS